MSAVDGPGAGIDAGKTHHHCVVIDAAGKRLLSRRVAGDEAPLLELIGEMTALAGQLGGELTWAVDLNSGGAALLIAVLVDHDQRLLYIPGRTVHYAAGMYRADGKTDAKDAAVIADQARMRHDLHVVHAGDPVSVELRILTGRRADLAADRTRTINRLRAQLLDYFPALERAFDYSASTAALVLLTGYQTPAALRRIGANRVETWLRNRKVRNPGTVAQTALEAANAQHTTVTGQDLAAAMVARLAKGVMALDEEISEIDTLIVSRFRQHTHAEVILSLPGFGIQLAAEFLAYTGGDMTAFGSADRLAGVAGLAPVPRDSGRVSGNLHRPRRYSRRLLRVFYLSAMVSIRCCPASRTYYDRKQAEGKRHTQAVLALARRRLNVLSALLRDGTTYQTAPNATAA